MRHTDPTSAAMAAELNRALARLQLSPYIDAAPTSRPGVVSIAFDDSPRLLKRYQLNVDALKFARWVAAQLPSPRVAVHALMRKLKSTPRVFRADVKSDPLT